MLPQIACHQTDIALDGFHGGLRLLADVLPCLLHFVFARRGRGWRICGVVTARLLLLFIVLQLLPKAMVVHGKFPPHADFLTVCHFCQYVIDLLGVQDRHLQRIIIFLSAVCDESLDTRVIHRVYDGFHCNVTGEIPVLRITLFRLRHMAENTMQNDV